MHIRVIQVPRHSTTFDLASTKAKEFLSVLFNCHDTFFHNVMTRKKGYARELDICNDRQSPAIWWAAFTSRNEVHGSRCAQSVGTSFDSDRCNNSEQAREYKPAINIKPVSASMSHHTARKETCLPSFDPPRSKQDQGSNICHIHFVLSARTS